MTLGQFIKLRIREVTLRRWQYHANVEAQGNLSQWIRDVCNKHIANQDNREQWLEEYINLDEKF